MLLLLPRKQKLCIFGSWFGSKYSDNPKWLFEYIIEHKPEYQCYWISKSKELTREMKDLNLPVVEAGTFKSIWLHARAKFAFVSQSVEADLDSIFLHPLCTTYQLWHGIPLKKIVADTSWSNRRRYSEIILKYIARHQSKIGFNYIISTGKYCTSAFMSAFLLSRDQVIEVGFPRLDFLPIQTKLENSLSNVLYAPTLREGKTDFTRLFFLNTKPEQLDRILCSNHIKLTIRPHPVNVGEAQEIFDNSMFKNITLDTSSDIYESINNYDILITDFSSLLFDFLYMNKALYFTKFDDENFRANEREIYASNIDYELKPFIYEAADVIKAINNTKQNLNYLQSYEKLRSHFYISTNLELEHSASSKIFEHMNKL